MERSWKAEPSEADTWQLPRRPKSTGGAKYKYLKRVIFGTTKLKYPGLSVISDKCGESSVLFDWAQCHLTCPSSSAQQLQPHRGFCLKCNFKPHLKSTESESLGWWLRNCFLTLSLDYLWWRARIKKFFLINKFIFIFINFSLTRSFVKCPIQGDKSSNRSLGGCYKSFKHLHSTCFPFLLKTGKKGSWADASPQTTLKPWSEACTLAFSLQNDPVTAWDSWVFVRKHHRASQRIKTRGWELIR